MNPISAFVLRLPTQEGDEKLMRARGMYSISTDSVTVPHLLTHDKDAFQLGFTYRMIPFARTEADYAARIEAQVPSPRGLETAANLCNVLLTPRSFGASYVVVDSRAE